MSRTTSARRVSRHRVSLLWCVVAIAVLASFTTAAFASRGRGSRGSGAYGKASYAKHHRRAVVGDPYNDRLAVQVGGNGLFNFGAFPDPANGGARNDGSSFSLSFVWPSAPSTSFTTLRVADSGTPVDTILSDPSSAPVDAADHLSNVTGYTVDDVGVTQTLSVVPNPLSGQVDLGRIEYTVTNNGTTAHNVGLRYMNDVDVANNDAAPFRVPNVGPVTTETDFSGAAIPTYFNVFNDLTDSTKVGVALLKGSGATTPDRVAIASWPGIHLTVWDYTTTPGAETGDSAYADWWNPAPLAPGASRTYVTYYGLGNVTVVSGPDLGIGLVSPASLALSGCVYDPNPFSVVATAVNNGTATATGVTATIALPAGLSLASGTAAQAIADLAPGASGEVTWNVQAADRAAAANLAFSVTAAATGVQSVTANRAVDVPAIPADCSQTNQPPVANDQNVSTVQDTPVGVTLTATDPNNDTLTYSVVAGPVHGTLSGTAPNLTYTPAAGYTGADSFTFKANDGTLDSNTATVGIDVTPTVPPENRPPVAQSQSVSTPMDTAVPITLAGSDPDGDPLSYAIAIGPSYGTLSGTAPNVTYTPAAGYTGPDAFTFVVNDGKVDSAAATVAINVTARNRPPRCHFHGRHGHGRAWHVGRDHHWGHFTNGHHGRTTILVHMNGTYALIRLGVGESQSIDFGSAMNVSGDNNVSFTMLGSDRDTAAEVTFETYA